jgi:hypothetical protein
MGGYRHTLVRGLIGFGFLLAGWLPAFPTAAAIFTFQQTAASVPGLVVTATMTIDGDPSDLPTIDSASVSDPVDFDRLLAFDLVSPVGHFALSDFTPMCLSFIGCTFGFPDWSISPGGISFIDALDASDFFITGLGHNSTIQVDTDGPVTPPECGITGACVVTGNWIAAAIVPEPSSMLLLIAGLAAACLARHHRRYERPCPIAA